MSVRITLQPHFERQSPSVRSFCHQTLTSSQTLKWAIGALSLAELDELNPFQWMLPVFERLTCFMLSPQGVCSNKSIHQGESCSLSLHSQIKRELSTIGDSQTDVMMMSPALIVTLLELKTDYSSEAWWEFDVCKDRMLASDDHWCLSVLIIIHKHTCMHQIQGLGTVKSSKWLHYHCCE